MTASIQTNRAVRIVATNGTDESMAFVFNEDSQPQQQPQPQTYYEKHKPAILEYSHNYYALNRESILAKKKIYNAKEENKERSAIRHRHYYQSHKEELSRKHKKCRNNKKR
ncbi:MAG TPA: hypothetical protein VFG90_10485 [Nitrososphaeraceae archaeon]|nr:hypothetical protein [Nitrososphaeraceae archaeon]